MDVSFMIPYPKTKAQRTQWTSDYSLNAYYGGKHWSVRAKDAEYWHMLTVDALHRAKIPKRIYEKPVRVVICYNDGWDIDNHGAVTKMIIDGMKGYVIKDDTRKYVNEVTQRFWSRDYIGVYVTESEEEI